MSLVGIWIGLNAVDLGLTYAALRQGAVEANTSINWFNVNDTYELVIWKALFVFAFLVFLAVLGNGGYLNARRVLSVAILAMFGICLWNFFVLEVVATLNT